MLLSRSLTIANGGIALARPPAAATRPPPYRIRGWSWGPIDVRATNGVVHTIDRVLVPTTGT